jgi:hypothetical protein
LFESAAIVPYHILSLKMPSTAKDLLTAMDCQLSIGHLDLVIVVAYLAGIVAFGLAAASRQRKQTGGKGYFLAGRTLTWPAIGLAHFATNISRSTTRRGLFL